jgi:hypothetical protein
MIPPHICSMCIKNQPSRQTGSRNLMVPKTLHTILCTNMKIVTKYQISAINSCWEKCDKKWAYMFNVYKNQQSRQTRSRNLMGPKTLPMIWGTYMKLVTKYQISAINSCWEKCDEKNQLSRQTGSRNLTGPNTLPTIWHTYMKLVTKYQISAINSCWEKCDEKYIGRTEGRTEVKQYISIIHMYTVIEWLLFNVNSAIFQLYHGENKLIFKEAKKKICVFTVTRPTYPNFSPRFLCRPTTLYIFARAVERQSAIYTEHSWFASPALGRHISTFRGYRMLLTIRNPYINRFTNHFSIHS